jgi:hypothetical protein
VFAFMQLASVAFKHERIFDASARRAGNFPTSLTMARRSATASQSSAISSANTV